MNTALPANRAHEMMRRMIRKGALCLLAGWGLPVTAFAQPSAPPPPVWTQALPAFDAGADHAEARNHLLHLRLDAAAEAYTALRGSAQTPSETGAALLGRTHAALWRVLLTEDDHHAERFFEVNDDLTDFLDSDALDGSHDTDWVRFLEAEAGLYRSIVYVRQERMTKAALTFHGSCGRYRDVAPSIPAAQVGLGVCQVAAGSVPSEFRWITRLFGFRGTVPEGLSALSVAAAQDGGTAHMEATVLRALLGSALAQEHEEGVTQTAALVTAYPESPVTNYMHGLLLLRARRAEEAEAMFHRVIEMEAPNREPLVSAHHMLGLALFRQNRFEAAAEAFERYLRSYRGEALVAQAQLHAGLAYEMAGDRRTAEAYYRRVRALRGFDSDRAAEREAKHRLETPITSRERILLLGANAFDGGRYDEAVDVLRPIFTDQEAPDLMRAEAAYRTGRTHQVQGELRDALRHYRFAINSPGDPEAKWAAWSLYHSGEVLEAQGKVQEARDAYEAVLEIEENVVYKQSLEQQAKTALARLN